jgi:hypothetical protein
VLIWKLLFSVVGLHSHIPYEAVLLVAHIAAVLLLFTLVRRRSGDLPAFAAGLTLLVLGSGGTDIVWAFQIGFVGSVAFGLLAMLLLEGDPHFPTRLLPASGALLASLMCSGVGLAFLAAIAVELALDTSRRRFMLALVAPVAAYAGWSLTFGAAVPPLGSILSLAGFVVWGVAATGAGVLGYSGTGGVVIPILIALVAVHWYRQRKLYGWQVGMGVGLVAWFTLAGLGRAQRGPTEAGDPRYVYPAAVFLLPLLVDAARDLPWRSVWRPALIAGFALAMAGNVAQLWNAAESQSSLTKIETSELQTMAIFRGTPDMALNRSPDKSVMPHVTAGGYFGAVDQLGSPVPISGVGDLSSLPPHAVDRTLVSLFGAALTVTSDSPATQQPLQCQDFNSLRGSSLELLISDGQSVMLQSDTRVSAFLFLGSLTSPSSEPIQKIILDPSSPQFVKVPNTGRNMYWRLAIRTGTASLFTVCATSKVQGKVSDAKVYSATAHLGQLDPGWSAQRDGGAFDGYAAEASGTSPSARNVVFGDPVTPPAGSYDVWYRVRVTRHGYGTAEMTLGLWDDQAENWIGSTRYTSDQIDSDYSWIKVASGTSLHSQHSVHFVASFIRGLSTDWYIDQALLAPASTN